jgi:hypothetical protein
LLHHLFYLAIFTFILLCPYVGSYGVVSFRQSSFSPIFAFANWRISTSFSPIGKYRTDIRQLANILWRNKKFIVEFPHDIRQLANLTLEIRQFESLSCNSTIVVDIATDQTELA